MICSSVCRFRVMGLLLSAHHSIVGLPNQWCSFRGEGQPENLDPFTAVLIANVWHHWSGSEIAYEAECLYVISHCPSSPVSHDLKGRLMAAVQNYSFVPRQV